MSVLGQREVLEKDFPKVFSSIHADPGSGLARGYERAAASYEDLVMARPNPHDVAMNQIVARHTKIDEARDEREAQREREQEQLQRDIAAWKDAEKLEAARTITVGDAWLQVRKAVKTWLRVLPCGLSGWHAKSVRGEHDGRNVLVCSRCRAWRIL